MDEADREIDRLTRTAEKGPEHFHEVQLYELDEQKTGRDSLPKFRLTGSATHALSHTASDGPKLGKTSQARHHQARKCQGVSQALLWLGI